jgi:glycosyltransferase involved in cell wall biosynthesis
VKRISVVTPNFNMGRYLEETMQSVFANLGPGDEYFVIDGESCDESFDIIRRHEARLTGWVSEPDRGYADALRKGFARASGDVLCWINSSDVLLLGTFDRIRSEFSNADVDMIFGDDFYFDEDSRVVRVSRGYARDIANAMLHGGWTPLQDACFWTRQIYDRVDGIDPALKAAADYDFFLRIALTGRCKYLPVAFSAFRRHSGQKSIAQQLIYAKEREAARRRQLARSGITPFNSTMRYFYHKNLGRVWARVGPLVRGRRDLAGRPIAELACDSY